ncbi:flagellar hook protein FlgE [Stakelama saccharophila]|uniref:Flagellar hook protein FlgE n=1 Tax=Stakelama saccharophila TaxID=3075605 RepID=A0ABZ0B8C0_9SPHN|nr:flagellar hook protein FlgE [Stakelama sp. W311]WNO53675.1 flagellar hook protein FlgE [Stakelama sp. W311]
MAFYTSLSGLQAAQTEMSTISHNLANVSTDGFKKSRTAFADVIASSLSVSPDQMVGSGVATKSITQQFGQGTLKQSGSSLDLAIAGDGFFAVKPKLDTQDVNFTRNGGFSVDSDRYVVDAQGAHLQVYPVDGSGAVVASGLDQAISLRLPQTSGEPKATSSVALGVNLNASSEVHTETFDRFNTDTFNQSTSTTIYDAEGNAQTMTSYFVRKSAPDASDPTSGSTWEVHNFVGDQELQPSPVTAQFDAGGNLTAPTAPTTFNAVTPSGSATPQVITFDMSSSTQLSGPFSVATRTQDGTAVGQLQGVTVDSEGIVSASFSNGETKALGKVALANFSNPGGLRQLGNSNWTTSALSGEPIMGAAGENGFGSLMSSMVEGSNVDITEELVGLIAAQRNFQANAKALDTSSKISQAIFNIQ